MKQELLEGLTNEQIAKVKACKSSEEMLTLAKDEGVELTDEQFEAVNGGCKPGPVFHRCQKCGSVDIMLYGYSDRYEHHCKNCGDVWIQWFD